MSEVTKNSDNSSSQASRGMLYVVLISISIDFYFLSNVCLMSMSNVSVLSLNVCGSFTTCNMLKCRSAE